MEQTTPNNTQTGKPAALRRRLQKNLRRMKRLYRSALAAPEKGPAALWLCDNFYVLEKEAKQTARDLQGTPPLPLAGGIPQLYSVCLTALAGRPALNQGLAERLAAQVGNTRDLTVAEFGFFPLALRAALLQMACAACEGAGDEKVISYAVTSLTKLSALDFDGLVARYSVVEAVLQRDPAGIYPNMEKESRGCYRALLGYIARKAGWGERAAAEEMLNRAKAGAAESTRARHVGQYILHSPLLLRENSWRRWLALGGAPVLALALAATAGWLTGSFAVAALALLPLWEFARPAFERAAAAGARIVHIPRMNKASAEVTARQTVVAVSVLVPRAENAPAVAERLEQLYFSNAAEDFTFCLLADFKESDQPVCPGDEPQLKALKYEIERLNAAYGGRFLLFVRGRVYSPTQGRYAGWERKRGAITELIRFAKGDITTVRLFVGDKSRLERMCWLLALDCDTNLPFDAAGRMAAAAAHPLNRAVVDEQRGVVTEGYGIFVPRMATTLESRNKTAFSRVMAGAGGVAAYDEAAGDMYQDLFGEAIFAGKGLLDTECFYRLLNTRFPENKVLSHDILEGAFLRAALLSDVELTDSFPSSAGAWFSRLGRWTRGDWQNSAFLFGGPLGALSRYKLFDNLRRSLTPVLSLACAVTALFVPAPAAIALFWAALLAVCGAPAAAALEGAAANGMPVFSRKFFALALPPALEQLARAAFSLILLPQTALVCLQSAVLALYRRFFSHKNLLEWVTAAESEGKLGGALRQYGAAEFIGLAVLFFTPHPFLHFYGLAFSAALPLAVFTGARRSGTHERLAPRDREQLTGYCAAMWRFFERYAGAEEHYLPPDNLQQSPVYALARRTSPTNIGLLLLSQLAARDLSFITPDELFTRVSQTLTTVEKLEKWRGNLYNWYDTSNLALLEPRFVSSVDSGNFVCCLVALKEGLRETPGPQAAELAARVEALIAATDLAAFYDERRELFSIGYNVSDSEMMDSYYDFFMSEARMAGYYAIASRQVPRRHWGVLSRAMSRQGAYAGPVSWTGTMFEYFMPHLLLPVYEGSLLCEALDYCLYCQRRRAAEEKVPWGISESAYYKFDTQLNYQYKAHGVQKLGVKRGMNDELVVSPYSTFLALQLAPVASMKNLRRMEELGFCGGYGFYEAIDYTQSRVHARQGVCRSFMSHHLGMSLVAADNALFEGRMQRRFLRDSRMNAAKELLQEKLCRDAVFYDNVRFKDFKEREAVKTVLSEEYENISPQNPQVMLLSNGAVSDVLTGVGAGWLSFAGRGLTRRTGDLLQNPAGIYAFLSAGGECFSLTAAPLYQPAVRYRAEFLAGGVIYRAKLRTLQTGIRVLLHPTLPCEQREYQIKNLSQQRVEASLLCYCEPTLALPADYAAHPAFSKLFVTAEYDAGARVLVFTRREREGGRQDYFAVGFLEDVAFEYEAQRENLMNAPNGFADLLGFAERPFTGGTGTPDAACAMRLTLEIPAGGRGRVTQLFAAGQTRTEAVAAIAALRRQGRMPPEEAPQNPLLDDSMEGRLALALLPRLLFAVRESRENDTARAENTLGTPALWALAISGDRPIVLFPAENGFDGEHAACYLSLYKKCGLAGVPFDLVFTVGEAPGPAAALEKGVREMGCGERLGAGVYIIDLTKHSGETRTLLWAAAVHTAPKSGARVAPPSRPFAPAGFLPLRPAPIGGEAAKGLAVAGGVFSGGRFFVDRKVGGLPFSHILANPTFGTLVGDTSLGFTWAVNARENKLTPWSNDIATGNLGERLLLRCGERIYDLVNGSRASFSQTDARYEGMAEDMHACSVVTVPEKGCAKIISVTLTNQSTTGQSVALACYTEPVLGVERAGARQISTAFLGGCLICRNPFQTAVRGVSALCCDAPDYYAVCDRAEFLCGRWEAGGGRAGAELCAALLAQAELPARGSVTITFRLVWAANAEAAVALARLTLPAPLEIVAAELHTPDRALNELVNHFVPHQILQCRVWGRAAFYQCGGAFGFRDQLQDVTACLLFAPQAAKIQILRAAAAQFPQGDVLHWWHNLPKSGGGLRGVRTKYSDDLLWLPFAVSEYVRQTGDEAILRTVVPFVEGEPLGKDETERYFDVARSGEKASVYEHCARALEHAHRLGAHGLPLIGCGDWNDGFNTVGGEGKGESVWLAMFLAMVLERFAPLARLMNDSARAEECETRAAALKAAVDKTAWDGVWYLRAFYDDGTPMGAAGAGECEIDSLPQSFSALCGMPDKARVAKALESAIEHLALPELRVVKLFDKPFAEGPQKPGYIKAYPAGVRENGGQYTHAGVWLALALLHEGKAEEGLRLLGWMNPAARAQEPALAARYKLEPYYIPADIYTSENAPGRGGWSLYTGAASWYYKAVTEQLLGCCLRGNTLSFSPCVPAAWQGFSLRLSPHGTPVEIKAKRGKTPALLVDGTPRESIPLDGAPKKVELIFV